MDVTQGSPGEEIPARLSALLSLPHSQASSIKRLGPASQNAHPAKGQGFVRQTSAGVIQSVGSREADPSEV